MLALVSFETPACHWSDFSSSSLIGLPSFSTCRKCCVKEAEAKMAARRCVLFLLYFLLFSVFEYHSSCEKTNDSTVAEQSDSDALREVKSGVSGNNQDERRWQSTDVETDKSVEAKDSLSFRPAPKDQFQEELIIRPLHSGDIYASFQFRTLWDTDFLQEGNKGGWSSLCYVVHLWMFSKNYV